MHACTVVSRSRLAHARVLARSILQHHPGSTVHTLVLDPNPHLGSEPFEVLAPGELFGPAEWGPMLFAYTTSELAYATKARLLGYVLDRYGDSATYVDSDIRFYHPMEELEGLLADHDVILTPHVHRPVPGYQKPTELTLIEAGVYNSGFVSVGRGGRDFLGWWARHLERQCLMAPEHQLNGDQRWLDLAPTLFDCHILRNPTANVAYWNLPGRRFEQTGDRFLVDGEPLTFFHFSAYDPHQPWLITTWPTAGAGTLFSENPALLRLCSEYRAELMAAGYDGVAGETLDQRTLPNGVVLDARARRVYREAVTPTDPELRIDGVPNPLTNPNELVAWLREPAEPGHPVWLSRYLYFLYRERPGLVKAFPQVPGADARRFLAWVRRQGTAKAGVPEMLMPTGEDTSTPGLSAEPVGEGVNVIGYLRGELGLGEGARQLVAAAQSLAIPLATFTYAPTHLRSRQEHDFADLTPVPSLVNPFDVNIVCLNGPEASRFSRESDPRLFSGRCTVGYWAWELERFPATWSSAFDCLDEVWVNSEFAAKGFRDQTTKPVRVFPVPVPVPVPDSADRQTLGLPEGFLFLFVFDYGSIFERKNPVGVVRAFRRAFTANEGPVLVLKSVRGEHFRKERERLHFETAGRPDILLLEDYLSAGDKDALLASCDCYVSLHRSEGFGLTMAEAMALGKPTIATGYSGNLEFMNPDNSFLVRFTPGRVPPGAGHYPAGATWAEPDLEEAADLMRRVYLDPTAARGVGERARVDMARLHGPDARARLLQELLTQARREWRGRRTSSPAVADVKDKTPHQDPTKHPRRSQQTRSGHARQRRSAPGVLHRTEPAPHPGAHDGGRRTEHSAEHDLVRLLRRLGRPPLGWVLARHPGYRRLRDRWLGDG